jgi:hypothetical protein
MHAAEEKCRARFMPGRRSDPTPFEGRHLLPQAGEDGRNGLLRDRAFALAIVLMVAGTRKNA